MSGAAVASLFAQSGVIRTETLTAAFDVAQLLSTQPVPVGDRVAIVGNSTALGMLAVDACLYAGLRVADGGPRDLGVDVSPERSGRGRAGGGRPPGRRRAGGGVRADRRDDRSGARGGAAIGDQPGHRPGAHHRRGW